jgi:hypothetical protein
LLPLAALAASASHNFKTAKATRFAREWFSATTNTGHCHWRRSRKQAQHYLKLTCGVKTFLAHIETLAGFR